IPSATSLLGVSVVPRHAQYVSTPLRCLCLYCSHYQSHSFPTRRSSDLARMAFPNAVAWPASWTPTQRSTHWACGPSAMSTRQIRSEEHTSELQSRFDLVCRLLLEKKKMHIQHLFQYYYDDENNETQNAV